MYRVHTLPTQPTKEPSIEDSGGKAARSVSDSLVLLQALRQSRQTWLTSAFAKFSTKSRGGKGSEIWQPPHTIRFRGKCDLEIGPHVFYATSIYEVIYQPYQVPVQTPLAHHPQSGQAAPTWSTPYPYTYAPQAQSTSRTSTAAQVYSPSTPAVVSSIKGAVPVTNDLISQVNAAAITNPTLANLLGLAASGSATPEQLQTLGVLIQSLAESTTKVTSSTGPPQSNTQESTTNAVPTTQTQQPVPPPRYQQPNPAKSTTSQPPILSLRPPQVSSPTVASGQQGQPTAEPSVPQHAVGPSQMQTINKEPDVVIEFYENSSDRWILPKDLVLYEKVKRWDGNSSLSDIIFSTFFPFENSKIAPSSSQAPLSSAGTAAEPHPQTKDMIHPITLRFFNVPPAIWNLFSKAAGDEERTKRVRVAMDAQLDKASPRAYLQHQIVEGALLTQLQASLSDRYPTKSIRPAVAAIAGNQTKRRNTAAARKSKDGSLIGPSPPKRRRTAQAKKQELKTGKCEGCLQSSVTLVPDTPYCPTCDKAKKAKVSLAQPAASQTTAQPAGSTSQNATLQSVSTSTAKETPVQPAQAPHVSRPSTQGYYTWSNQPPYIYQYQTQPTQPQNSSSQSTLSGQADQTKPSQSTTPQIIQASSQPTDQPQSDSQPTTSKPQQVTISRDSVGPTQPVGDKSELPAEK